MSTRQIKEKTFSDHVVLFIATGGYSGYFPFAPGTAGTVAAIPVYLLFAMPGHILYLLLFAILLPLSFWASGRAEKIFGAKDSGMIVIDEIAGYLVTMFMVPAGWQYVVAGFFLFRFFDISKIYPAGSMEKIGGGVGVVMDDIVAGVYANLSLWLLIYVGALPW
ncbi:MAG: phosphatidylglycerophosphatase A [Deltaproteobacteria bacterium]|nr:phosphatidylglycerophosphatase A [Deltaproteobacteria bacterium]